MTTALILGAAVWANGPSPSLRRRTLHAATLYHAGKVTHLIPCGGMGQHPPTEAAAMTALLISAGIPADAITPEDKSTTTMENIRNALPLLQTRDVVIVTDAYHGPRARMTARAFGLDVRVSAPPLKGSRPMTQIKGALREIPALILYRLRLTALTRKPR
jgi:vancomycin permeability regulator SanA